MNDDMPLSRRALVDADFRSEPTSFRLDLKATELHVREALKKVIQRGAAWDLSEDACNKVEIVLAEALNNVVEHAYAGIPDGIITLDCAFNGKGISIVISDQGHPVPETLFLTQYRQVQPIDTDDLPEGGFGWTIIRELAHDLKVSRIGQTTLLSLTINTD